MSIQRLERLNSIYNSPPPEMNKFGSGKLEMRKDNSLNLHKNYMNLGGYYEYEKGQREKRKSEKWVKRIGTDLKQKAFKNAQEIFRRDIKAGKTMGAL